MTYTLLTFPRTSAVECAGVRKKPGRWHVEVTCPAFFVPAEVRESHEALTSKLPQSLFGRLVKIFPAFNFIHVSEHRIAHGRG